MVTVPRYPQRLMGTVPRQARMAKGQNIIIEIATIYFWLTLYHSSLVGEIVCKPYTCNICSFLFTLVYCKPKS